VDPATLAASLWIGALIGTIIVGVITNAIWDWIKEHVSLRSSKWPKMTGQWSITHPDDSRPAETAIIQQQFGPNFRGELITPSQSDSARLIIQVVRGKVLEDRKHALFTARQKLDSDCTEITTGLISLDHSFRSATGKSVFFGETAPIVDSIASWNMKKVN
jgi:hypothetical protein